MIAAPVGQVDGGVVLIVEDDLPTAELQRRAIQDAGMAVRLAGRVADAVRILEEHSIALVLVDYRLPDGDALAVLEAARAASPSVPVIVVTGLGDERIAADVIHRGAADYVIKRGDFWEELPRTVRRVLQAAEAERANARLASIVGASDDAILGTSPGGLITSWNSGAERCLGYAASEAEIEHVARFFAPDRRQDIPDLFRRVGDGETIRQLETVWLAKDGAAREVSMTLSPIRGPAGSVIGVSLILRDISERKRTESEMQLRLRQQAAIAVLGRYALESGDRDGLMQEAVRSVSRVLGTQFCEILELATDASVLVLLQGIGWPEGLAGRSVVGAGTETLAGQALRAEGPVIVEDLQGDTRFPGADRLRRLGIRSGLALAIRTRGRPFGVIGAYSRERRAFSENDANFLQAVANILEASVDRTEAAADLRRSEEQFRQIAETIDEVFWMTDRKTGAMLYVSPAFDRIWGRSREDLYARPDAWLDAVHADDRSRVAASLSRAEPSGFDEPYRIVRPDGGIRWIHAREFLIRNPEGEIYRTTGIASDITDLKAAEEASNEKARLAALTADIGIAQTRGETIAAILQRSAELLVSHLGAAFARVWTLNAQRDTLELQASAGMYTHLDGAHGRVPVGSLKIGLIALERKPHLTNDVLHDPRIGDPEWARREGMVSFVGYPLMVGDELVGVMALFARRPLGEFTLDGLGTVADTIALGIRRKQAETTQAGLEDQLRQAQKMEAVGRLAGGIAHDFNNLLSVILGYGNLLLTSPDRREDDRRGLEQICKAAERAGNLTRQLLAFSRRQVLIPEAFDLRDSVRDISRMLGRLIGEDVELSLSFASEPCRVLADRGQIDQVLTNLAVNSRDAMPQGGRLTVEVRHADFAEPTAHGSVRIEPGPYVLLAVSDTGVGMSAETQSHVFEPFFTTKGPGEGTGLGLATVYGIVKQSGGYIWMSSEAEQGTTFKIYLPRTESEAEAAAAVRDASLPGGSETILLVEDDEMVRGLAQLILEERGYRVLTASGGEEALRLSGGWEGPIHLLLTDVIMRGMNGRELVERLTPERPETRVVYMSGYTGDAVLRRGIIAEKTHFIQKPFTPTILSVKVREVLDEAVPGRAG